MSLGSAAVADKSGCTVCASGLVKFGFGEGVVTSFMHCFSGVWAWPFAFASSRDSSFSNRVRILLP